MNFNVEARLDMIEKIKDITPGKRLGLHSLVFAMQWVEEMGKPLSWESVDEFIIQNGGKKGMMHAWLENDPGPEANIIEMRHKERENARRREYRRMRKASCPPLSNNPRPF